MILYDEIVRLCKLRGITIDILMKKIGKTSAVYFGWRARDMVPRADDLYAISKILNVSMEHFFEDDDSVCYIPKQMINKLENLSDDDLYAINNLSPEQLQNMIALCKSIKN